MRKQRHQHRQWGLNVGAVDTSLPPACATSTASPSPPVARGPRLRAATLHPRSRPASTPPHRTMLPLDPHRTGDPLHAALGIRAVPHHAHHGSTLRRGSGPRRTALDVDPRRARRGSSIWAMGALQLLSARHLGSLLSGCGGRETEEQNAGREEGDELLPVQCGARAALTRRAEFAPSRSKGRRE